MRLNKQLLLGLLLLLAQPFDAHAQLYGKFGPANGIQKCATTSPQCSAASSSDILATFSGTCNSTTFARGDGQCATPAGGASITYTLNTPTGTTVLSSLTASTNGAVQIVTNNSTDSLLVLLNEDTSQTASTRLTLPRTTMFLTAGSNATFVYDTTSSRWRLTDMSRDPVRSDDSGGNAFVSNAVLSVNNASITEVGSGTSYGLVSFANTNEFTQQPGFSDSGASAAGNMAGFTYNTSQGYFFRGSSSTWGGFFVYAKVRWSVHPANDLGGVIVGGSPASAGATANPSTYNDTCSISWDATQTALQARCRDTTTTNSVSLGVNYPSNSTTAAYEIAMYIANGQARFNYWVRRLDSAVANAAGSLTTNLPTATTPLRPSLFISNNATASAGVVQWNTFTAKGGW